MVEKVYNKSNNHGSPKKILGHWIIIVCFIVHILNYTVPDSIIQCQTVLYSARQYYTVPDSIIQCQTVLYSARQYYTVLDSIIQC